MDIFSSIILIKKSTAWGTNAHLSGVIILLNFLVKKGYNFKHLAFKVMPLVLQLHLVKIIKYSKFDIDTINTFWVMGYIKVFAWWCWRSSYHNSLTFSTKQDKLIMDHIKIKAYGNIIWDESACFSVMFIKKPYKYNTCPCYLLVGS